METSDLNQKCNIVCKVWIKNSHFWNVSNHLTTSKNIMTRSIRHIYVTKKEVNPNIEKSEWLSNLKNVWNDCLAIFYIVWLQHLLKLMMTNSHNLRESFCSDSKWLRDIENHTDFSYHFWGSQSCQHLQTNLKPFIKSCRYL